MVGSISKIGQFFDHLNFEKYELIRGAHFQLKFSSKSGFVKLTLYSPPHIDFNTIPYFTYGCPYRGVKEGRLKILFYESLTKT